MDVLESSLGLVPCPSRLEQPGPSLMTVLGGESLIQAQVEGGKLMLIRLSTRIPRIITVVTTELYSMNRILT